MPRRARPVMALVIEGLSDGKRGLRDEFSGEVIAETNARVPMTSDSYARAKSAAIAAKRAKIVAGLLNPKPIKPFKRRI